MIDCEPQSPILIPAPNLYRARLFIDVEAVPAGQLVNVIQDKDDLWRNPVAPVPARLYQAFPYLFGGDYFEFYPHPIYGRTFGNFVELNPSTFFRR